MAIVAASAKISTLAPSGKRFGTVALVVVVDHKLGAGAGGKKRQAGAGIGESGSDRRVGSPEQHTRVSSIDQGSPGEYPRPNAVPGLEFTLRSRRDRLVSPFRRGIAHVRQGRRLASPSQTQTLGIRDREAVDGIPGTRFGIRNGKAVIIGTDGRQNHQQQNANKGRGAFSPRQGCVPIQK